MSQDYSIQDCSIVGYEEGRQMVTERDVDGTITNMTPVPGSDWVKIHLELPGGRVIKVSANSSEFHKYVAPLFPRNESGGVLV